MRYLLATAIRAALIAGFCAAPFAADAGPPPAYGPRDAAPGANDDITSLSGLTTPLSLLQGGTGSTTAAGVRFNIGAAAQDSVNPTDAIWAGGADPTGVLDSAPALSAALSVPALSAVVPGGGGGTGYAIGNVLTASASNVGLICSVYPTFSVSTLGAGNSIATVSPLTSGLCANTTAIPSPPGSSAVPTYFSTTGGSGSGATLNIAWAPRNAKVQFPCGTFLFNSSVGAIHDNTEIAGNGECTVIKAAANIAALPNTGGNFGTPGTGSAMLSNADFANGNSNIRIHDMKLDSVAITGGTEANIVLVQAHNFKIDHVHFFGGVPVGFTPNTSGVFILQSDQFWIEKNVFEGFVVPMGLWQGSTNWWITDNYLDGKGAAQSAMQFNGLGSAQFYPPVSNTTTGGLISGNTLLHFKYSGMNLLGLCSSATLTCGTMNKIRVTNNIIDGVEIFEGIVLGDGEDIKVLNNIIFNTGRQCIILQGDAAGVESSNVEISGNLCKNANTLNAAATDGITVSTTNSIVKNLSLIDNKVIGGGYTYAVRVINSVNQAVLSAVVATNSTGNVVGDILTATGGTPSVAVPAAKFRVTAVDGSGQITALLPVYLGSYSSVPANPVSVTSNGPGVGTTLTVTWKNEGAFNTIFKAGIEDAGSAGTDSIGGTSVPINNYSAVLNTSLFTFKAAPIAVTLDSGSPTLYSQMQMVAGGSGQTYQIGVGGGSETLFGVANCAFLYVEQGRKMEWRVCPDGSFNINPIVGTAAVATLDVNGTGRVAPGTFAAAGTCNAANEGKFAAINDSTTNTWGATITGSGANHIKGYCDGTNWTVYAK